MDNAEPICRICLLQPKTETLMPTDSDFCTQIEQCTGITLSQHPYVTNKICTSCALLLRAALKLRSMCQQTEEQLGKLKEEHEQKQHQQQIDSDCELPSEYVESYVVTLETENSQGSAEDVTVKPSTPTSITVPTSKLKRRSHRNVIAEPPTPSGAETGTSGALSYMCNICNNVYTDKVKLSAHIKVHSVHKPHECEICHKRFRQTPQLARHMNSHTGLRPYKCDYCNSSFADPSTRIKHQRIHTKERPYQCKYCSKAFAYSNVLNVHLKLHTGERPYKCQYCGRRFSQEHHKNTHERVHRTHKNLELSVISVEEE